MPFCWKRGQKGPLVTAVGPFLAPFLTKGHLRLILDHCNWCQIKAWNVPHQFWFQKCFLKQQTKPPGPSKQNSSLLLALFLDTFWTKGHLRLILHHCNWCQIKAWNVLHQFWLQKCFLKQQTKPPGTCKHFYVLLELYRESKE